MAADASFYICVGFALCTLLALLMQAISRPRFETQTLDDSIARTKRILADAEELATLEGKARAAKRRKIAKEILLDIGFIHYLAYLDYADDPPKSPEVREHTLALFRQIHKLHWELHKNLFLFRFRPRVILDCRRIINAMEEHQRVWIAYCQLLKTKYPELYGSLSIPDVL